MDSPPKEGKAWLFASALALPSILFSIYNPDLFWHLSAGRWILEHWAFPRADFLSFSAAGTPWLDFEWLSQVIFQAVYALGGMTGLWALKSALVLGGWLVLNGLLKTYGIKPLYRAGAFALWSAGALPYSDIRPELFSVLFFAVVLRALEGWRIAHRAPGLRQLAALFLLFAVWANLHAGFVFGLILIGLYAVVELQAALWVALGAAILGTFCQPYGLGPYKVGLAHWAMRADLSRYIREWHPLTFENPIHWPIWVILLACGALILYRGWKKRLPWAPALGAVYFGLGMLAHTRVASFFNAVAVPVLFLLARDCGWLEDAETGRPFFMGGVLAYALYLLFLAPNVAWTTGFNYKFVPRQAAEFMETERPALEGLKLYNMWEWGGYLGWRLSPWYKVYGDGRYIFHPQLAETAAASLDAESWQTFMKRRGLDGGLLPNLGTRFPTERVYPDKKRKSFARPWYLFFMPAERWALVYWDDQALLFVDRRKASAAWLSRHEYRYDKPKDEAAFADALSRREIPSDKLAAEAARHARETGL